MDQVIIRDLRIEAILGVYPKERETPQEVLVNLVLYTDLRPAGASDQLEDTLDYHSTALAVEHLVQTRQRFTVEALAADIAGYCLRLPRVQGVRVRVEKSAAVPQAQAVGVEIERFQEEPG